MANENFGMMEGAFFVSKNELIFWVNQLLALTITKVEQMASGAAYCQIIDIMFPGSIQLSKVNWQAKYDHEFINNYKLLQQSFDKNNVHKHIEVEKLVKAKYQDNLEFFQWFKRFFDLNCKVPQDYDPVERRKGAKVVLDPSEKRDGARNRSNEAHIEKTIRTHKVLSPKVVLNKVLSPKPIQKKHEIAHKTVESLEKNISELRNELNASEKEREFFFEKLRTIELYCDHHELKQNPYLLDIQKVLFATEDEKVNISDDGVILVENIIK
jgi:microtubule-associated protein, RP/EB family